MKKACLYVFFIKFLLITSNLSGQQYLHFKPTNNEVSPDTLKSLLIVSVNKKGDSLLTSASTLNCFFATKSSTYLSEASDLSLSKAYAVLDNSDGRLFLGGTFYKKQSDTEFQRLLFTGGIKVNVKDGFANLFGANGINNDIGFSFKMTVFGRGSIWFYKHDTLQKKKLEIKRIQLAKELLTDFDTTLSRFKKYQTGFPDSADKIKEYVADYSKEMKQDLAQKEAAYIIKKALYNVSHDWWLSFDLYLPATKSTYENVNSFSNQTITSQNYKPYEFNVSYTNFWDKKIFTRNPFLLPGTTLLTVKGSLIANNSASASLIDAYSFDNYLRLSQNPISDSLLLAKVKTRSIYVGNFENFLTPRISARYVYMPLSFIGVSAAVEKNFGKVDDLNWRLGIPVSLKNNEDKAKINFELVWKEIRKEHLVGISIGLPINNTIF